MGRKKSEGDQIVYHFRVGTFRRTLELRIGGTKEEFDEQETGFDYNLTGGMYRFDADDNCNIIWLRDYNLNTLVHELIHCVEQMCKQVGIPMEGEPPAFIYEELFTKIMSECGKKFKLDKDTSDFYKDYN